MDALQDASGARTTAEVAEAYRVCREIARKEAKNFYYSFIALPEAKRNAICAVYAFMRHADDLSDDETISVESRQVNLHRWLEAWRSRHLKTSRKSHKRNASF